MTRTLFTRAQRTVITTDGVRLVGWDARNRPVVEAMVGIPQQLRRWALTRHGDPIDITEPVRAER